MFDVFKYRSKNYSRNSEQAMGDHLPCVLCGKPVEVVKYEVHLHHGGSALVTEEEAAQLDDAGDMGCYPLGQNCYRRCLRAGISIARYVRVRQGKPQASLDSITAQEWALLYADLYRLYRQVFGATVTEEEIQHDIRQRRAWRIASKAQAEGRETDASL
jgi:hypothetical protein